MSFPYWIHVSILHYEFTHTHTLARIYSCPFSCRKHTACTHSSAKNSISGFSNERKINNYYVYSIRWLLLLRGCRNTRNARTQYNFRLYLLSSSATSFFCFFFQLTSNAKPNGHEYIKCILIIVDSRPSRTCMWLMPSMYSSQRPYFDFIKYDFGGKHVREW